MGVGDIVHITFISSGWGCIRKLITMSRHCCPHSVCLLWFSVSVSLWALSFRSVCVRPCVCTWATGCHCNEDEMTVRVTFPCLCLEPALPLNWAPFHRTRSELLNRSFPSPRLLLKLQFITMCLRRPCFSYAWHPDRIFHNHLLVINLIVKGLG